MGTGASALSKEHRDGGGPTVVRRSSADKPASVVEASTMAPFAAAGSTDSSGVALGATAGGGLAARRKVLNMQVSTNKKDKDLAPGDKMSPTTSENRRRKIQSTDRFTDFYTLGSEVMPSTNTGMEVRHAKRKSDNNNVVIKLRIKPQSFISKDEEADWRASTEMILNLPKSENIAQLYEVFEDANAYYVVMEKVEGTDLFELLDAEGRISIMESRAILRKLLKAVFELHAKGCIHKDLKLENVMVDKSPRSPASPKSGSPSFGMSTTKPTPMRALTSPVLTSGARSVIGRQPSEKVATVPEEDEPQPVVKLIDFDTVEEFSPKVRAKSVVGTDQYIAQEAYAGHYSPASDIFSVGVIAYRLLTGRFPFKNSMFDDEVGENWVGSPKMKAIQDRLKRFEIDWSIPPFNTEANAKALVRWMLQVKQEDRPTAGECLAHPWLAPTGETPLLPAGPWRKSSAGSIGRIG